MLKIRTTIISMGYPPIFVLFLRIIRYRAGRGAIMLPDICGGSLELYTTLS